MPMYVLHGFRWPRTAIREFIILNNIDDAAPDYLMATTTPEALKEAFIKKFPHIMAQVPNVQFVEQHDPEKPATQTFAFVADVVFESDQSIDIDVARQHGPKPAEWDAFMDLKGALNELARMFYPDLPDFTIGWYAVWNGDPQRYLDHFDGAVESRDGSGEEDPDQMEQAGSQSPGKRKSPNIFKKIFK